MDWHLIELEMMTLNEQFDAVWWGRDFYFFSLFLSIFLPF